MSKEFRKLVVATARGYYAGRVQEPGDRFVITDENAFSENWMRELEKGESPVGERDLHEAAVAHAGAVGSPRNEAVEFKGKAMHRDDAVDEALHLGPVVNGTEPPPLKKGEPQGATKTVISQGAAAEVPGNWTPGPEPVVQDGKLTPDVGKPQPSKRTAQRIADEKK